MAPSGGSKSQLSISPVIEESLKTRKKWVFKLVKNFLLAYIEDSFLATSAKRTIMPEPEMKIDKTGGKYKEGNFKTNRFYT